MVLRLHQLQLQLGAMMATVPDRILGFVLGLSPLIAVAWLSRGSRIGIGSVSTWTVTDAGEASRITRDRGGKAAVRSDLLSNPNKMHAPSFSLPAVHTCPAVRCAIEKLTKKLPTNDQELRQLAKATAAAIPPKCVACYAYVDSSVLLDMGVGHPGWGGRYGEAAVKRAHDRRMIWFRSTPEDEVVKTLVAAIGEAGRTDDGTCKRGPVLDPKTGEAKPEIHDCKRKPSGRPRYVRLHDSGDFEDPRAARIWKRVAELMPDVKFWAPTTAQVDPRMVQPLRELNSLRNVTVRPSALRLDEAAPEVPGLSAGSAILGWKGETEKRICPPLRGGKPNPSAGKMKCQQTVRKLHGEPVPGKGEHEAWRPHAGLSRYRLIEGKPHYVCPGDCRLCRYCWTKAKKHPVAYIRHGAIIGPEEAEQRVRSMLFTVFPQFVDIGPH